MEDVGHHGQFRWRWQLDYFFGRDVKLANSVFSPLVNNEVDDGNLIYPHPMAQITRTQSSYETISLPALTRKRSVSRPGVGELDDVTIEERRVSEQLFNVVSQEDVPPNGGYGWVCTACVFLINAHTWGSNAAWAIFLAQYLANSTFPEASLFEYALIGGLSISQSLMIAPIVNIAIRKLGTRPTLLLGSVLEFLALFMASYANKIWHLVLTQGILFGWGMGFLYIPATSVLPQWFSSKRSLAVGIASSGAGLGGLAYNLIAGKAIATVGLSWTYRILAFCALGANVTASCLLKDRNKMVKPQQVTFDYKEFGRIEVVLIMIWGFLTELGYIVLLYSLPSYANHIGLSHSQGAVVGALLNLGLGVGRPIVGYFSDRVGRINVAGFMTALCGVLCLTVWVPAKSYSVLVLFATLVGFVCGTFWGTSVTVAADVVGLKRLPSAFSMICISLVLPTTFAEPVGLQIVADAGYLSSQIFVGIMFIGGAASTWLLRTWKICEIEKKAMAESGDAQALARQEFWLTPRRLFLRKRV